MKTFALTTKQAAKLAGVEPHVIYSHVSRFGAFMGVTPRKLPNGRLLWPASEVYQALGLVPSWDEMTPGERGFARAMDEATIPLVANLLEVCRLLLRPNLDMRGDQGEFFRSGESTFMLEVIQAFADRAGQAWVHVPEQMRPQAKAVLQHMALTLAHALGLNVLEGEDYA